MSRKLVMTAAAGLFLLAGLCSGRLAAGADRAGTASNPATRGAAGTPAHKGLPGLKILDVKTDHDGLSNEGAARTAVGSDGSRRLSTRRWVYLLDKDGAGRLSYTGRKLTCTPTGVLKTPFGELMYLGAGRGWQAKDENGKPIDMTRGIDVDLASLLYGFDIVETFDNTADWTGKGRGGVAKADDMPKLLDGKASCWGFFSNYNKKKSLQSWIGYHGRDNTLGGVGKSLCIDYGDSWGAKRPAGPMGPSRLATYFGKGRPKSGYGDVYVFFRVRLDKDFFPPFKDGKPTWWGYHKFLVLSLGFRDAHNWGTVAQQNKTTRPQHKHAYGLNCTIINTIAWGSPRRISLGDNLLVGVPDGTKYEHAKIGAYDIVKHRFACRSEGGIDDYLDKWAGLELHYVRGQVGKPDGHVVWWVYDEQGNATKIHDVQGVLLITLYDHKYNRFEFGGNRFTPHFKTAKSSVYYVDDFIVNGRRIGPKYFEIVNRGAAPADRPQGRGSLKETPSSLAAGRGLEERP